VNYTIDSASECQLHSGTWMTRAQSESECSQYPFGCKTPDSLLTGILDNTTQEECNVSCHSAYVPMFRWSNAVWVPGRAYSTSWVSPQSFHRNEYVPTLNFSALAQDVLGTFTLATLLALRAQAVCTSSSEMVEAMDIVTCSCASLSFEGGWSNFTSNGSLPDPNSTCAQNFTSIDTYSMYHLCGGRRTNIINTYFSAVCTLDTCIDGPACYGVLLNTESADLVARPRSPTVSLSFVQIREDSNKYAVVQNSQGLVIGQVIGDSTNITSAQLSALAGGSISWNSNVSFWLSSFCLTIRSDILGCCNSSQYSELDLGIVVDSVIVPLNLPDLVLINPGISAQLCSPTFFVNASEIIVYPIQRYPNYENIEQTRFDQAELGIIFTTCGLYLLAILLGVFLFSKPVVIQGGFIVNFTVFAQILILYIIRCVYFFLLGYSVIPTPSSSNLLDYILIELPTFFYLGAFSLIAISFLFLYLRGKKDMDLSQSDFWVVYFIWDLLIWILFAVVVSLIATLSSPSSVTKSCNGRISELIEDTNTARLIRIVYKSVIALIALILVGVTFMIGRALSDGLSRFNLVLQLFKFLSQGRFLEQSSKRK
jgi:hypothetical protein